MRIYKNRLYYLLQMGNTISCCFNCYEEDMSIEEILREYDLKNGYLADGTLIYGRFDSLRETTDWRIYGDIG